MKRLIPIFAACALPAALPAALLAQDSGLLDAQIIAGGKTDDGRPLAALVLTLAPDWKTYWRSPGEGGLPPEFDWSAAQNLAGVEVLWPAPEVFHIGDMANIGYHDRLVLPLALTPIDAAQPVALNATVTLGICQNICVPVTLHLSADVPQGAPGQPLIAAAMAQAPMDAAAAGVQGCTFAARPIKDGVQVDLQLTMPSWQAGMAEMLVVEHRDRAIWASPPQVTRKGDDLQATFDLVPPQAKPFDLNGADLRLTVLAGGRAGESWGCAPRP